MVDLPLHVGPGLCLCPVLVCATGLVLDSLLAVCLTACRRRDKEDKWLPFQARPAIPPPYDPASISWSAKSRLPHHAHPTLPTHRGPVGDPARQVSGTRRQAPTRVSQCPLQGSPLVGPGTEALLSRFRDPSRGWCWQSVIVGVRATSEPGRGGQACCPSGIPRNRQCSPPQHARQALGTKTLWLVPVRCRPRTR